MATRTNGTRRDHPSARYSDFAHTGPGTLAGRFMRTFWQPVARARDLPAGHAKPIRVMSEDFTLYRGEEGTPHLVAFRCAHRGTQLSTGWVEGDCIRCFYHGWKYDGSGQCVEQPAEDAGFASKVKIESYPCEEYLGLIFAYLGEGAERGDTGAFRPPLPRYPRWESTSRQLDIITYTRDCNFMNNIENNLDEAHLPFVHRTSRMHVEWQDVPRITCEPSPWGATVRASRPGGREHIYQFGMPNLLYTLIAIGVVQNADGAAVHSHMLSWRVPIDDERHVSFNAMLTEVAGDQVPAFRAAMRRRGEVLASLPSPESLAAAVMRGELKTTDLPTDRPDLPNIQDYIAQVGQGAIRDVDHERLGTSDRGVILMRQLWARELRAFAEGKPLTPWRYSDDLPATVE